MMPTNEEEQVPDYTALDSRLKAVFPAIEAPAADLNLIRNHFQEQASPPSLIKRFNTKSFSVLAGTISMTLCLLVVIYLQFGGSQRPFFKPTNLTIVYNDLVTRGFEPYYNCSEEMRFRLTMEHRHGMQLNLRAGISDIQMLGVSYTGGLSRDTTAILFVRSGKPVVLFVDSLKYMHMLKELNSTTYDLRVFTKTLGDVVLVEVTPFQDSKALDVIEAATPK